jgi:hypothetical protein
MPRNYKHLLVSSELNKEVERVRKIILDKFAITISKVEATKIISWKSQNYNIPITESILLKIIRG